MRGRPRPRAVNSNTKAGEVSVGLDCLTITLPQRLLHFRDPVRTLQHLARLRPIGRAHDSIAFHQIDEVRRAPVANPQTPSLSQGGMLLICVVVASLTSSRSQMIREERFRLADGAPREANPETGSGLKPKRCDAPTDYRRSTLRWSCKASDLQNSRPVLIRLMRSCKPASWQMLRFVSEKGTETPGRRSVRGRCWRFLPLQ